MPGERAQPAAVAGGGETGAGKVPSGGPEKDGRRWRGGGRRLEVAARWGAGGPGLAAADRRGRGDGG